MEFRPGDGKGLWKLNPSVVSAFVALFFFIFVYIERARTQLPHEQKGVSSQHLLKQIIAQEAHPHHLILKSLSETVTQGTLMQIGANIGAVGNDPLYQLLRTSNMDSWKKYFIEPIPPLYKQLVEKYKDIPNSSFINVGIQSMEKTQKHDQILMYCFDWERLSGQVPGWFSQICSMNKDRLQHPYDVRRISNKLPGKLTEYIVEYSVETCSVPKLLQKEHINAIHIFIIDTEGMDDQIVSDFITATDLRPWFIIYEDVLLSSERKRNIETILKNQGYSVFPGKGQDTIALLLDLD